MPNRNLRELRDSVLIWFVKNPDEELYTIDIAERWAVDMYTARTATRSLRALGWLDVDHIPIPGKGPRTHTMVFRTTEKLRKEIAP